MIDLRLAAAATMFALVSVITPGPNNLMLAASGLNFGFRRTLPMMLGFQTGLLLLLLGVASGLGVVFRRLPWLHTALKIIGAIYLLYLAWKLWRSSAVGDRGMKAPLGFVQGLAFQFINPKGWMMTVGAVSAYSLPGGGYWPSIGLLLAAFTVMGVPSIALWTAFGGFFRATVGQSSSGRWLGRALAVLTALSCLLIFL